MTFFIETLAETPAREQLIAHGESWWKQRGDSHITLNEGQITGPLGGSLFVWEFPRNNRKVICLECDAAKGCQKPSMTPLVEGFFIYFINKKIKQTFLC